MNLSRILLIQCLVIFLVACSGGNRNRSICRSDILLDTIEGALSDRVALSQIDCIAPFSNSEFIGKLPSVIAYQDVTDSFYWYAKGIIEEFDVPEQEWFSQEFAKLDSVRLGLDYSYMWLTYPSDYLFYTLTDDWQDIHGFPLPFPELQRKEFEALAGRMHLLHVAMRTEVNQLFDPSKDLVRDFGVDLHLLISNRNEESELIGILYWQKGWTVKYKSEVRTLY
ncbi:MAG: hypothetical protein EP332_01755 [Bacteroidetes bacterium]|nr:MAG: hypothetical protein EP332_01755 [Bacteroidota bacterium]